MDWWLPEARRGEWGKWGKVVQMYKQANKTNLTVDRKGKDRPSPVAKKKKKSLSPLVPFSPGHTAYPSLPCSCVQPSN